MRRRGFRGRLIALLAVGCGAFAPAVAAGWTAPAAADGSLVLSPARGSDDDPMQVTTPAGCPLPATNVLGTMYGPGFGPAGINIIGNTAAGVSSTAPFTIPVVRTLRNLADTHVPPVTLHGTYTIVLMCRAPFKAASYADYTTSIQFASPHRYAPTTKSAALPRLPRASAPPPGTLRPTATATAAPGPPGTGRTVARQVSTRGGFGTARIALAAIGGTVLIGLAAGPWLIRHRP